MNRFEFSPLSMTVIKGSVCLEISESDAKNLKKAFKHFGTWYIREDRVRFTEREKCFEK